MGGGDALRMTMATPKDDDGGEKSFSSDTMLTMRRKNPRIAYLKRVHRSFYQIVSFLGS